MNTIYDKYREKEKIEEEEKKQIIEFFELVVRLKQADSSERYNIVKQIWNNPEEAVGRHFYSASRYIDFSLCFMI